MQTELNELLTRNWSVNSAGFMVAEFPNGAGYYRIVDNTVELWLYDGGENSLFETWNLVVP